MEPGQCGLGGLDPFVPSSHMDAHAHCRARGGPLAAIYTLSMIAVMRTTPSEDQGDFSTFDGVHQLLANPDATFPAWLHFCVADLLIGRWIFMDARAKGISLTFHFLVMVPCLFVCMMLCPCGLLLYMLVVQPLLVLNASTTTIRSKKDSTRID